MLEKMKEMVADQLNVDAAEISTKKKSGFGSSYSQKETDCGRMENNPGNF